MRALTHRCVFWSLVLLAVAAMAVAGGSSSAAGSSARPELGKVLYRVHCLNCHGDDGKGQGPLATVLTIEPPDLTLLTEKNAGVFPTERTIAVIDGREELRTHGKRDMPVWGLSFQDRGRDTDQEDDVRQKIRDLVAYLKTLQASTE